MAKETNNTQANNAQVVDDTTAVEISKRDAEARERKKAKEEFKLEQRKNAQTATLKPTLSTVNNNAFKYGKYIVAGELVDAKGNPIEDDDD